LHGNSCSISCSGSASARRACPGARRRGQSEVLCFPPIYLIPYRKKLAPSWRILLLCFAAFFCALPINTGLPLERRPMRWARRIRFQPPDQNLGSMEVSKSLNTSFDHNGCRKEFKFSCLLRDFSSWSSPSDSKAINSTNSFRVGPIIDAQEVC